MHLMSSVISLLLFRCVTPLVFFFFFSSRRRHTRLQGDWSSDVCSSDLPRFGGGEPRHPAVLQLRGAAAVVAGDPGHQIALPVREAWDVRILDEVLAEIGRGSCRGRGEISGVAGSLKKKKKRNETM